MKVELECYRFIQTIALSHIKVGRHLRSGSNFTDKSFGEILAEKKRMA